MAQIFGSFQRSGIVYQNIDSADILDGDIWMDHANAEIKIYNGTSWEEVGTGSGSGFTGSQGAVGFTGSKGDTGFTGSTGFNGSVGFTGSASTAQGPIGFSGSKGGTGTTGFTGSQGDQGTVGFTGSKGDIGFTGSKGDQGLIGFTGSSGAEDATLQSVTTNGNTTTTTIFATTSGQHEGNVASRDGSVNVLDIGSANDGSDATITADVTGDVVGDLTGDVTSTGTSSFSGTIDAVGGQIMGNIDGDVRTRTGSHKIVDVGAIGDGTDSEINIHDINVAGTLSSDDITSTSISITGDMLVTGDTVMTGNLTVNGETTIINSNTIASGDELIVLNADLPSGQAPSLDSGLEINRGSSANVQILWVEGSDYFELRDINGVKQDLVIGNLTSTGIDDNATSTAITIDASENVGIGTDAPSERLEVGAGSISINRPGGASSDNHEIKFKVDGAEHASINVENSYNMRFLTNSAEAMRIDSIGSLGIGTGGGVYAPLHVKGSSSNGVAGYLRLQNATTDTGYTGTFFSVDPRWSKQAIYARRETVNGVGPLIFAMKSNTDESDVSIVDEVMRIDTAGRVGLGTTAPTHSLTIIGQDYTGAPTAGTYGTLGLFSGGDLSSGGSVTFGALQSSNGFAAIKGHLANGASNSQGDLAFYTRNISTDAAMSERMRIDSGGNLLVGTATPVAGFKTTIASSGNTGVLSVNAEATSGIVIDTFQVNTGQAAGAAHYLARFYSNSIQQFGVRADGKVYAQDTTIYSISDARTKENVREATEGLDVINALRPVRFDYKEGFGNGEADKLGFIAQEVEAVFPDAVIHTTDETADGDLYKAVGTGAMIPVLVKAIQEQQEMINELKAEVAALKGA